MFLLCYQEEYFLYTMTLWVCQGNFKAFLQRYSWIGDIEGRSIEMRKKNKKKREFKGPWHASAHVRHFDFWSSEPFFKIGFWWKNPFPLTLRRPRKLLYQYSRAIWFILEVLNAIFCILRQHFRSHWGEVHEGILFVVSVPTNGSNVAFNVVIWLSFLSIKFSSQRSAFFG